jgi:hypothetical protein
VDPGKHSVFAIAAHHANGPVTTIELLAGESKEIVVEVGEALPEAVPEGPIPTAPPIVPMPVGARPMGAARILAIGSGAAGVVGLGLGAYFGLQAVAHQSGSPGICHGQVCDEQGTSVRRGALQSADESTAAFVVAGALVAAGVVLWLAAPARVPMRPMVGLVPGGTGHAAGASVVARF